MKGCFVRGQRTADYNWELLAEFDSVDDAKKYVKSMLTEGVYQRVYNYIVKGNSAKARR